MARVKLSGLISEISGSVGGMTFQRNNAGNSLRSKPRPVNKSGTASQNSVKLLMSLLQNTWLTLSDANKLAWVAAALYYSIRTKHNSSKELTAFQLYIKHGMYMLLAGRSSINAPTLSPTLFNFTSIIFSVAGGVFYMYIVADSLDTNNWLMLKVSGRQKLSESYQASRCRNLTPLPPGSAEYNITSLYTSVFGVVPVLGDKISYQLTLFGLFTPSIQGPVSGTSIIVAH